MRMQIKITRSITDDTLYAVSDGNRTRPMRSGELVHWLRELNVRESEIKAVLDLAAADSLTLELDDRSPGQMARAS